MQTCALLLGLVMLAGANSDRPYPTSAPLPSECCEFLRLHIKEFLDLQIGRMTGELLEKMQRQGQRSAKALGDALQLQEKKTATALQGVVQQMEQMLQDRDEAALRRTLDERLQRMEEGARALGKPSTPSPEREDAAAAGGLASLQQLERRVLSLEASCIRVLPLSTPQAPPATPSASTPFTPPSPPTTPFPTTSSIATTTSSSSSTSEEPSAAPAPLSPSAPIAHDQQTQRIRVQERIKETRARMQRAEAQPSPLWEALRTASRNGSLEEVQRLLNEGADVNYTTSGGSTPLRAAAASISASSPNVASLLLSRGADVSAVDEAGWSALHWAAFIGNVPVVRLLLGAGAEVDARDKLGATPLHRAAYNNNEAIVRALLAGGASKELKCWDGWCKDETPFDEAESDAIRNLLRP